MFSKPRLSIIRFTILSIGASVTISGAGNIDVIYNEIIDRVAGCYWNLFFKCNVIDYDKNLLNIKLTSPIVLINSTVD